MMMRARGAGRTTGSMTGPVVQRRPAPEPVTSRARTACRRTQSQRRGVHRCARGPGVRPMDMKLELIVLPVTDVDRAKSFYRAAGFREDVDYAAGDDFRVVQFTPPGSE